MINKKFHDQVNLLLKVLPEVAKETCFALHGGTAINLFMRNMPRLSVDIDLTYIPLENRKDSIKNINNALSNIKRNLEKIIHDVKVEHKKDIAKLMISVKDNIIKLEVNLVDRGLIEDPIKLTLCDRAQNQYDTFVAIQTVSIGQLYGGKICAALDRQHPRDYFDIKYLMSNDGLTEDIISGFLLSLVGSDRPMHEVLNPNLLDQKLALSNQFSGMTSEKFDYEDYEKTRTNLIDDIRNILTTEDKEFLLSVKNLSPDWEIYNFKQFPSVQWKLQNLEKLKSKNPKKYKLHLESLEEVLFS